MTAASPAVPALTTVALRTTVVGSYPQPDWLVDRALLGARLPPRVRAREIWRVPDAWLERSARRCDVDRDPRHGAGRDRHHQRRRDPARELFEPLRDRARRRRHRATPGRRIDRTGHPNPVPRIVGPIRRRTPVMVRDVEFLRAQHRSADQDHGSRSVHDVAAGAERLLSRRRERRAGLCGSGKRRTARSASRRRRRRADRRAVPAGAVRRSRRVRVAGDRARARGHRRHDRDAHVFRLRARRARAARRLSVSGRARRARRRSRS